MSDGEKVEHPKFEGRAYIYGRIPKSLKTEFQQRTHAIGTTPMAVIGELIKNWVEDDYDEWWEVDK